MRLFKNTNGSLVNIKFYNYIWSEWVPFVLNVW